MKIAILIPRAGPTNAPLFRKLSEYPGVDLTVYYCSDFGVGREDFDSHFRQRINWGVSILKGYKYKFLKNLLPLKLSSSRGIWLNPGIIQELLRGNYDALLVHGWNYFTSWLAFLTSFITKTPILLHGENPLNQELLKSRLKRKFKKIILGWFFKRVTAFLYIGEENRKFYQHYGVPESKLFFVPYAVDNKRYVSDARKLKPRKSELKSEIGIDPDKVAILFVGRLIEKKKSFDLLEAYETVTKNSQLKTSNLALVFVGDGVLRSGLEDYTREHRLEDVYFAGFKNKPELWKYYALADIFVLPSGAGETWGIVVNEAMCFGLPVVVSDLVGSGPDLVRNGENGYTFPTGNIDVLSNNLKKLVEDDERRKKFGRKSSEIIQGYNHHEDIRGILRAVYTIKND